MTTRIYLIESKLESSPGQNMLIEATNVSQALSHAIQGHFTCRVATTLEVAAIMRNGGEVEKAEMRKKEQNS